MSAVRSPLVHLIVHRCSSACCSAVAPPACPSLAVAVMYLFRVTGPSLIHLLVHRSCVCSCTTGPSVRHCSAVGLSAGVVVTGPWFVHRSSIYWSRRCPVTWLHLALFHFCSTVRLFDCSVLHSARLDFVLLGCSTLLALCAFLFYLLVEFGRHAVHTLCPTRDVPSMGYHSFAVPCSGVLRAS